MNNAVFRIVLKYQGLRKIQLKIPTRRPLSTRIISAANYFSDVILSNLKRKPIAPNCRKNGGKEVPFFKQYILLSVFQAKVQ